MGWRVLLALLTVVTAQEATQVVSRNFEVIPLQGYNVPLYHFPVVMTGNFNAGTPPQPLRVALLTTYPVTELNCTRGSEKNYHQERSSTARNVSFVKGCVAMPHSNVCGYVVPSSTGEVVTGHFLHDKVYLSDVDPSQADYDRYAVDMQFACKDKGFRVHPQHHSNLFADLHGVVGLRSVSRPTKQFPKSYLDTLFEEKHISHNMFSMCFSTVHNSSGTFGIGRMILGGFASEHHSQPLRYTPMFRTHQTHVYTAKLVYISLEKSPGSTEALIVNETLPAVLASGDPVSYLPARIVAKLIAELKTCKPQGCFAGEDLTIEPGTVCYTSPVVEKFPTLVLSFQGVKTKMNATDYLYPVEHAQHALCLNFLPWKKIGNKPPPELALLGIRFFQNRDIVFDTDLSVIGFADANCAGKPHAPDDHGGYNAIHLKDGEPVLSASTNGTYKYFNYVVKPGAGTSSANLVVALTALDGDPDLYVSWNKYNMPPTRTKGKYDIKSSWRETLEYVVVPGEHLKSTEEVTISIGIFAYHSNVKFSVVAFREGESAVSLLDGLPMFGSVKKDQPMHFLFVSPRAKSHSVEFTLIADTGSPDLYATGNTNHLTLDIANGMQWPTATSSEFKSTSPGTADDYIIVKQQHYESYLLSVFAQGNSTFHITATSTSTTTMLKDGKPQKFHVGFGKYRYFSFFASKPNTAVSIDLTNEGSGDPDLYVSCFIEPTGTDDGTPSRLTNHYNWSSTRTGADSIFIGANETCAGKGQASMFYIAVKGFRSADFSIVVSTLDGPLVKLRDSKPQQSFILSSQYKFFQFTLPKDNVNTTLITRAADAGALEIYVTTKKLDLESKRGLDDPCTCSMFGARGVLGLAPGCGKHPWPEAVPSPYCYVDKPELCSGNGVKNAVAALRSTRQNKVKHCDLNDVSSQLPIGENEKSFQLHGDGSTGLTVLPDQAATGGNKVITIGVRATVSTAFQITATTSANLPIPLANGAMSAQHFIKDGVELFEFNYMESSKPFVVMITAEHGKPKWYLAKKTAVADGRKGSDAWLNLTTAVATFNPGRGSPCVARPGVQATPLCNAADFFKAGSFIIGVEKDGTEDLLFSVTVTLTDTETELSTGRKQYKLTEQHGDASSEYIAKFVSKSYWEILLEISTLRMPSISSTYCTLDVFIYSCVYDCKPTKFFQNRADSAIASDVRHFSVEPFKVQQYNMSKSSSHHEPIVRNYILVVAHKTETCEPRVPFTIMTMNTNSMALVDESCFERSADHSVCQLHFGDSSENAASWRRRGSRSVKIRYYLPKRVFVEVEACGGKLSVSIDEVRFGQSNARGYMRVGGLHGLESFQTGYEAGAVNILYLTVRALHSSSFNVNIYKDGVKRLRNDYYHGTTVTVVDLHTVRVDWTPPISDGTHQIKTEEILYDVYWWRSTRATLSDSHVLSTQCGLQSLPDVQVAKDIRGLSYTVKSLAPGGSYYFIVLAKCTAAACKSKLYGEVVYKPRFQVMVQEGGWMVVGLVVLSALVLSLLIPAVVYARRMYKEKQVLKRQLEYEMCDVRNVIALDTERSATATTTEESNLLGDEREYQLNQI